MKTGVVNFGLALLIAAGVAFLVWSHTKPAPVVAVVPAIETKVQAGGGGGGGGSVSETDPKPVQGDVGVRKEAIPGTEAEAIATNSAQTNELNKGSDAGTKAKVARKGNKNPKELKDPLGRAALAWVGVDADAEAYWVQSIFDTSIPEKEREDLMEDLNEEGFEDPHNIVEEDIPVILARLQLIEAVAPGADEFMQEHLAEAYKDLVNMLAGKGPQ